MLYRDLTGGVHTTREGAAAANGAELAKRAAVSPPPENPPFQLEKGWPFSSATSEAESSRSAKPNQSAAAGFIVLIVIGLVIASSGKKDAKDERNGAAESTPAAADKVDSQPDATPTDEPAAVHHATRESHGRYPGIND